MRTLTAVSGCRRVRAFGGNCAGPPYVVSLPALDLKKWPKVDDFPNLKILLTHVESLHYDMF